MHVSGDGRTCLADPSLFPPEAHVASIPGFFVSHHVIFMRSGRFFCSMEEFEGRDQGKMPLLFRLTDLFPGFVAGQNSMRSYYSRSFIRLFVVRVVFRTGPFDLGCVGFCLGFALVLLCLRGAVPGEIC